MKEDSNEEIKPIYTLYHVFMDNHDDWLKNLKEAREYIKKWKRFGHTNLRIYEVGIYVGENGITYEEDIGYVYGEGRFPI